MRGDTWATPSYPAQGEQEFPVNQFMLAKKGIYNLELIDSRALTRDQAFNLMVVLGRAFFNGATQVNGNPVAIR